MKAFDLFSGQEIEVPPEPETLEADAARYHAAVRMGDVPVEQMPKRVALSYPSFISAAMTQMIMDELLFGSPPWDKDDKIFVGLLPLRWPDLYKKPIPKPHIYHTYEAPALGHAPAAKPDQPRHWVAMNQAPRRLKKR